MITFFSYRKWIAVLVSICFIFSPLLLVHYSLHMAAKIPIFCQKIARLFSNFNPYDCNVLNNSVLLFV